MQDQHERPPLADDARQILDNLAALGMPPLETLPVAVARQFVLPRAPGREMAQVFDTTLTGPAGDIPVRVYQPRQFAAAAPGLVYLHGGGWVVGTLDSYDNLCRELAAAGDCIVVSVDYRLAPEHPYPAAIDDCVAAYAGVVAEAARFGIDPERLAIAGDSAGGNLAAAVCLRARDASTPLPRYQVLYYPVVDAAGVWPSYEQNARGYLLTRAAMDWFWNHYAGHVQEPWPQDLAPLRADSHANLPPALVVTAGYDPLRDEGEAYAARLDAAGVPTALRQYPGQIHGFVSVGQDAADCIAATGMELRRVFGTSA